MSVSENRARAQLVDMHVVIPLDLAVVRSLIVGASRWLSRDRNGWHARAARKKRCNDGRKNDAHGSPHFNNATAAENVRNDTAVVSRMILAIRPVSAAKRSASSATLLAEGSAATSTITVSDESRSGTPSAIAALPSVHT